MFSFCLPSSITGDMAKSTRRLASELSMVSNLGRCAACCGSLGGIILLKCSSASSSEWASGGVMLRGVLCCFCCCCCCFHLLFLGVAIAASSDSAESVERLLPLRRLRVLGEAVGFLESDRPGPQERRAASATAGGGCGCGPTSPLRTISLSPTRRPSGRSG